MQFENIIRQKPTLIKIIDNPSIELCILAVSLNPQVLQYIEDQTDEICLFAVKQYGNAFQYVKNQTDEICLFAVKQNGNALNFVKNQTDEICLVAVKQTCIALQYVKNQINEICLFAVKQNGNALQYVKNQTVEICWTAIRKSEHALMHIDEKLMLEIFGAIMENQNGFNLSDEFKEIIQKYYFKHNVMIDILCINCKDQTNEIVSKYNSVDKFIHDKFKDICAINIYNVKKYSTKKEIHDDPRPIDLFYINKNNKYCVYKKMTHNMGLEDSSQVYLEKICECYQININVNN